MAGWNGAGSFSISFPDFVAGTTIVSTQVDTNNSDFVTGLMHCLTVNGETVPTANLPMATFKHTGVGNASARDQYASAAQVQDSALHWVNAAGVTGTADAIALAPTPAISAYAEGQVFRFRAESTSTSTTPTVNVSSVGAKTIQKDGGALAVGDIVSGSWYDILYDGTNMQLQKWGLDVVTLGANTFTAAQTIVSTDAGAAIGPTLILDRDSASPAASDVIGGILFRGEDSAGNDDDYATVQGEIVDPTSTSEDGRLAVLTKIAGTAAARLYVGAGLYTAGVTGGDKGAGSINAGSMYIGGVEVAPIYGHIYGLTLSNNGTDATNDIDIAAGQAMDSTNARMITLAASITKRLDAAWAVGTNQGGLDTGAIANDEYHMWLIMRSDTGVVDVLFSLSATAPTMPANYDFKRRVGCIIRRSAAILPFSQLGDEFILKTPVSDVNTTTLSTTATLFGLTVPTGIQVWAKLRGSSTNAVNHDVVVTSPIENDAATSGFHTTSAVISTGSARGGPGETMYRTDTSGQIRTRASTSSTSLFMETYGWVDERGKDGQ